MTKTNKASPIILWLPAVLWAVVIFTLSSIETVQITEVFLWDFIAKKSAHVVEFAILFALVLKATKGKWILSYLVCFIYALSDEFHQSFVPGRTSSSLDLIFDLSGVNIASYIIWKLKFYLKWFSQNHQSKPKK